MQQKPRDGSRRACWGACSERQDLQALARFDAEFGGLSSVYACAMVQVSARDSPASCSRYAVPSHALSLCYEGRETHASLEALLRAQTNKLQLEYRTFLSLHCKEEDQEQLRTAFTHAWLLVNTRSFYWDYPVACRKMSTTKGKKHWKKSLLSHRQRPSSECLALCPLIDFFNHTIEEVSVHC